MGETQSPIDSIMGEEGLEVPEDRERGEKKRYSHLIVFGFGARPRTIDEAEADPGGEKDMGWHLTADTKARVLAAGELWRMGEINKIINSVAL